MVSRSSTSRTGDRRDPRREPARVVAGQRRGRALPPGQRPRQPDDDLDRALQHLGRDRVQVGGAAGVARQRLHRRGEQPGGVARRHARPGHCPRRPRAARPVAHRLSDLPVTRSPTACSTRRQRLGDLGRVGAAALGHVVLAAAAAAEGLRRDLDQVTGPARPTAGRLVGGHDDDRTVLGHAGHGDDAGPVVAEPAAHVEHQRAQVVRADRRRPRRGRRSCTPKTSRAPDDQRSRLRRAPAAGASWSISRSASLSRPRMPAIRSGSSSGRTLSASVSWPTTACSRARKS